MAYDLWQGTPAGHSNFDSTLEIPDNQIMDKKNFINKNQNQSSEKEFPILTNNLAITVITRYENTS
jgi:hypothetical protein